MGLDGTRYQVILYNSFFKLSIEWWEQLAPQFGEVNTITRVLIAYFLMITEKQSVVTP